MAIEVEIKLKIEDSGELIKKLKTEHFTAGKNRVGIGPLFYIRAS